MTETQNTEIRHEAIVAMTDDAKLSVRVIVILGGLEFLIVLALGLSGLISPGPGGFTVRVFDPGFNPANHIPSPERHEVN